MLFLRLIVFLINLLKGNIHNEKNFQFVFLTFIRHTPEKWGSLRTFFVRKYVKKVGARVVILPGVTIGHGSVGGVCCCI